MPIQSATNQRLLKLSGKPISWAWTYCHSPSLMRSHTCTAALKIHTVWSTGCLCPEILRFHTIYNCNSPLGSAELFYTIVAAVIVTVYLSLWIQEIKLFQKHEGPPDDLCSIVSEYWWGFCWNKRHVEK